MKFQTALLITIASLSIALPASASQESFLQSMRQIFRGDSAALRIINQSPHIPIAVAKDFCSSRMSFEQYRKLLEQAIKGQTESAKNVQRAAVSVGIEHLCPQKR